MLQLRGINSNIIKVLESWLSNSCIRVHWRGILSKLVSLTAGVRQGSVLSPILFSAFVDCVLEKLEKSQLGCFVSRECFNSFMYADDLILLSITVTDLQKMVNMCCDLFKDLDLPINIQKSHCIRIGSRYKVKCSDITINSQSICWLDKTSFLGITISSSKKFTCDWHDARSKFYVASNTIFSQLGSNPSIDIVLRLISTKCISVLMYGTAAVFLSKDEVNKLSFAYNCVFSKLFNTTSNSTIKLCQNYCSHYSFEHLYDYYRYCYLRKLFLSGRLSSRSLIDTPDYLDYQFLTNKYFLNFNDSIITIRWKIWKVFETDLFS
jgi:hypothetical protein